jgi:hypothetical protein
MIDKVANIYHLSSIIYHQFFAYANYLFCVGIHLYLIDFIQKQHEN